MPTLCVIVPTCQRPELLAQCLRLLPEGVDVVVTDDSRDDATREMLARDFPRLRWVAGPRRGPAANRNCGARAADAEWLVFLDDDCLPQPGWLEAHAAAMPGADVVEGRTVCPDSSDNPFSEYVENLTGGCFWSCNLAIRRAVFEELGGFEEAFTEAAGEDMEMAWRIGQRRLAAVFAPAAEVLHPARSSSWPRIWRRIWMRRWMQLYRLKTGNSAPLGSAAPLIVGRLLTSECIDLLRTTYRAVAKPDARRPRGQRFSVATRLLTFPLMLPWLTLWEFRFRKLLAERAAAEAPAASVRA